MLAVVLASGDPVTLTSTVNLLFALFWSLPAAERNLCPFTSYMLLNAKQLVANFVWSTANSWQETMQMGTVRQSQKIMVLNLK